MCGPLAASSPTDSELQLGVATVEWALSDFDSAMNHLILSIEHAEYPGSSIPISSAKATFIYLFADWSISQKPAVREDWRVRAEGYVEELKGAADIAVQDSLGFYRIVFGATREDVEDGRRMVTEAHRSAPPTLRPFYLYHEHIALKRLGDLLKAELDPA